jgi:acylphosphatase
MKQAHVFISGRVQGVGYRYFVKSNAKKFSLVGWVRNTEDGGVEAVFQGDEKIIEQMIDLCKQGPMFSEVKHVGFEWEEVKDTYPNFSIEEKFF